MKKLILIAMMFLVATSVTGCQPTTTNALTKENDSTEKHQEVLIHNQPVPAVTCSLERQNLINRYLWQGGKSLIWNCPVRTSFLYEISYGKIINHFTIKGKVSSTSSELTAQQQLFCRHFGDADQRPDGCGTVDQAEPDGSYGTNGDSIFFFDTDNHYHEWRGDYDMSDQPYQIVSPTDNVVMAVAK